MKDLSRRVAQERYPVSKEVDRQLVDFLSTDIDRAIVHPVFFFLELIVPQLRWTAGGGNERN